MGNYPACNRTVERQARPKPTNDKGRPDVKLQDLPEDLLRAIFSKLSAKEVVRTSVLSSEWRCIWTTCPKLSFSDVNVPSHSWRGGIQQTDMFIDGVNGVLEKHRGGVVDELEIKFGFDSKLIDHLNNWISFAMLSRTKNLAVDLTPASNLRGDGDHYIFPFERLDIQGLSCLQFLQLSSLCLKLPSQFIGFPNLRKLDLHLLKTTRQDLEDILCNCSNLEWLSIVRCHLNDEMKVVGPLSCLQYLQVMHCEITKLEFHAEKLNTFVYNGPFIPIVLHHASKLENAKIRFLGAIFQQAATSVLNGLPNVQNLTLQFSLQRLQAQWILDNTHIFSQLRRVQILLIISHLDTDKIIYLASFLKVAPFLEKLEVHFHGISLWLANSGPFRQAIPPCEYKYLKNMHVTGFRGARGQLEFLLHVVENAPAIEFVTVDTTQRLTDVWSPDETKPSLYGAALDLLRRPLLNRLSPNAELLLL